MKHLRSLLLAGLALAPLALSAAPKVTTAAGAAPTDIAATVGTFRQEISFGGIGNTTNGPFANGFRNINWDGTAEAAAAPNAMPGDFFNNNVRRGAVFSTPTAGATLQVSAATGNATNTPVRFGNLDASYPTRFKAFTEQRLFAAVGSTIIDTVFFVPGSPATTATVNSFGAVFCDVDLANTSSIECFDAAGKSLGKFFAPVADNGLSFVGVNFIDGERVARVRVTHGNLPLGPGNVDTATADVVATDDFMYGEPLPLVSDGRMLNISVRGNVGGANGSLIAGFVIGGTQPKTVLVRGVGPSLAGFGVTNANANPQVAVFSGATAIEVNNDWDNRVDLAQAAVRVGAFPLAAGSTDAAVLAVLNPGAYTLVVSGVNDVAGQVLAEVYEVK
ncbi:MAG: hypothetical protein NTV51_03230 [Verrucomicrobia bacterium]|nr:hypothetical protein [Verrucomicrobiota bacterium]